MNYEIHDYVTNARWNRYRSLELIPGFVPNPADYRNPLTAGLNVLWRSLLAVLMDELVEEQRVEYLDRCWALNELGEGNQASSSLHRFWTLIE